ncbi:MAG: hypothetical protein ACOYL6_10425 [Bacteriovoracaceae bacterium]
MKKLIFFFLFTAFNLAHGKITYPQFKVGCLSPLNELMKLDCTEENMNYEVLKTYQKSNLPTAKQDLENAIFNRARFFLDKQEYDYYSVLMIMSFPVPEKEKWLKEFQKIPGKRAPFSLIAMDRIQGKNSDYCTEKKVPLYLKEICAFTIIK